MPRYHLLLPPLVYQGIQHTGGVLEMPEGDAKPLIALGVLSTETTPYLVMKPVSYAARLWKPNDILEMPAMEAKPYVESGVLAEGADTSELQAEPEVEVSFAEAPDDAPTVIEPADDTPEPEPPKRSRRSAR